MCDVNVGIWECGIVHRKHYLDSSDGVGSEGEVDEWLRNVVGQWSYRAGGRCGWIGMADEAGVG